LIIKCVSDIAVDIVVDFVLFGVVVGCVGNVDDWMGVVDVANVVVVSKVVLFQGIAVNPWVVLVSIVLVGAPGYNNPCIINLNV
jgi:hypothetical protein